MTFVNNIIHHVIDHCTLHTLNVICWTFISPVKDLVKIRCFIKVTRSIGHFSSFFAKNSVFFYCHNMQSTGYLVIT